MFFYLQVQCCALFIVFIVSAIIHAKPRYKTEIQSREAISWKVSHDPSKRYRRRVSGLINLRDLCPNYSSLTSSYSNPLIKAQFTCYGKIETICRASHASCTSAIRHHGYTKCQEDYQKVINVQVGNDTRSAIQTINCTCAC